MIKIIKNKTYQNLLYSEKKLSDEVLRLSSELSKAKERINELEESIEKNRGIKVRNEVIKVISKFTKLEMVLILSGVLKLAKDQSSSYDSLVLRQLSEKIQYFIDKMDE